MDDFMDDFMENFIDDLMVYEGDEVQLPPSPKITVIEGELAKDVELSTGVNEVDGKEYSHARLILLEELRTRNSAGVWRTHTCNRNVDVWGEMAENVAGCIQGERLIVVGWEKIDRWMDENTGEPRSSKSIIVKTVATPLRKNKVTPRP